MNDSIWQSIAATSFWVYVLVFYFLYMGYRGKKPQVVPLRALVLLAIGLICFTLAGISMFVKFNATNASYWALMYMLGMGLGWLQFSTLPVKAIVGEKNIYIPGSWLTLCIIIAMIASIFLTDFQISFDPATLRSGAYSRFLMIAYGLVTGLYFGRTIYALRAVKHGPFLHQQ